MPVQTRERGGTENKLIHSARVLIFRHDNSLLLVPASFYSAAKQLNVLAESWAAWWVDAEWRCQMDQSFQPRPKAGAVIKSGLDHVAVIPRKGGVNRRFGEQVLRAK